MDRDSGRARARGDFSSPLPSHFACRIPLCSGWSVISRPLSVVCHSPSPAATAADPPRGRVKMSYTTVGKFV